MHGIAEKPKGQTSVVVFTNLGRKSAVAFYTYPATYFAYHRGTDE